MQAALATAAVATAPGPRSLAHQATPVADDSATVTTAQVEAALVHLEDLITEAMTRTGVPGAAVAVVHNDQVVYERGFGVREVGNPEAVTPETVFQIASLAKPISSTVVAAVIGDGLTSWDATLASLEPGFALSDSWVSDQIALRDLFSHRSGLPAYGGDDLISDWYFAYDRETWMPRLRHIPLATPFRTTYAYNNAGLSAAAFAVARAAGQSWEDLAETRLLVPLGMSSTSYRFADFGRYANRATAHYVTPDGAWVPNKPVDDDPAAPAGGVSTTVGDLTRWLQLQLGGGVFDGQQVVARTPLWETHRPHILQHSPPDPAAGRISFYGLGWVLEHDDRGRLLVWHEGDFSEGIATGAYLLPAAGLGIVALVNASPGPLRSAIPRAFLEMVTHGEPVQDWIGTIERDHATFVAGLHAPALSGVVGEPPPNAALPLPLDAYVGTYANVGYGEVTVRDAPGGLLMAFGSNPNGLALTHWDRDTFTYSGEGLIAYLKFGVTFVIGFDGVAEAVRVLLVTGNPDVEPTTFTRVAGS
jgi:CubicO group peptidase (beta-lactamase class C family)